MVCAFLKRVMKMNANFSERSALLDVAIFCGVIAVFAAIAFPLIRGAQLRQQTAECANKVLWAADAFDYYASAQGEYPHVENVRVRQAFERYQIDWWSEATDLGGHWDWFRSEDDKGFIAISNPRVSEKQMRNLDRLLDDGDLDTGQFRQYKDIFCYILNRRV